MIKSHRQKYIVGDGKRRQKIVGLKNDTDISAAEFGRGGIAFRKNIFARDFNMTAVSLYQSGGNMQKSGFSAAARPHERSEAALLERQRKSVQHLAVRVGTMYVNCLQSFHVCRILRLIQFKNDLYLCRRKHGLSVNRGGNELSRLRSLYSRIVEELKTRRTYNLNAFDQPFDVNAEL